MTKKTALPLTSWKFGASRNDLADIITSEFKIHPMLSRILVSRNITDLEEVRKYLHPSLHDLPSPFLMEHMKCGVERLLQAITNHERVMVYGDYDADGITAVVVLVKFLRHLMETVQYYIPHRVEEGYGLNKKAIDRFKEEGVSLIITVDCGISDIEAIGYAKERGIDTIILDHHEVPPTLPPAVAVINPKRPSCRFPFKHLAAVGIVFNFLIALRGSLRSAGFWPAGNHPNLKAYLDLVALGTIGDICPLIGENRIITKIGLNLITEGRRIGVRALKEVAGLDSQPIDSIRASYSLIPRINAAGRIGSPRDAVELLLCDDYTVALETARKLDNYNRQRQAMEREVLEEILEHISRSEETGRKKSFVFASKHWHPGIIGIVASRLVDRFGRPAVLISLKDGIGKGSGRSISSFNIYEGLKRCAPLLVSFGGHRYAAGMSIREEDIDNFSVLLDRIVDETVAATADAHQTCIDTQCRLKELTADFVSQLGILAPFGSGNPEPVLCATRVNIKNASVVGNNHLRLQVMDDGITCNSIWFNQGNLYAFMGNGWSDILFTPQLNEWNGLSEIQLMIKDLSYPAG